MRFINRHFGTCSGLLAAGALALFTLASPLAGQMPAAAAASTPKVARAAARPAPGGLHTGIQVHGKWTIVVRNPDGSIAAKREFENTLQLAGANALPLLLGGVATPGAWGVYVGNSAGTSGPCGGHGSISPISTSGGVSVISGPCVSVQPTGQYYVGGGAGGQACAGMNGAFQCSPNLKVAVVDASTVTTNYQGKSFTNALAALQLQGAPAITQGGTLDLDSVGTFIVLCNSTLNSEASGADPATLTTAATLSPAACESGTSGATSGYLSGLGGEEWFLTATQIPGGAITTVSGQTVQVTVLISFS